MMRLHWYGIVGKQGLRDFGNCIGCARCPRKGLVKVGVLSYGVLVV